MGGHRPVLACLATACTLSGILASGCGPTVPSDPTSPAIVEPHDTDGTDVDAPSPDDTDTDPSVPEDTPAVDSDTDRDPDTDPADPAPQRARRLVVAGDSWSAGLVQPLREALDAGGLPDVALTWQDTANAGSTARQWRADEHPPGLDLEPDLSRPRMLTALHAALDQQPPADALVLVLGGNDLNREADEGLGDRPGWLAALTFDEIEADLAAVVDAARTGRPDLDVVLVGYDYFHFEFLVAFGLGLEGFDLNSYNEAVVELERRKRAIAASRDRVWWSNHVGLLQHAVGDRIHVPFSRPNPFTGYPEYPPGVAPAPGVYPTYDPFPGGFFTYPAPLDVMPDGIHPSPAGFRILSDHLLDHGLRGVLLGTGWAGDTP